jgi:hypothetical protein
MEGLGQAAALHILKSELRLFEKTAEPLHLAHAQRALEQLMTRVKMQRGCFVATRQVMDKK